jgi:hypothetical protein
MNNLATLQESDMMESSRHDRGANLFKIGGKILRAPTRLIKMGIDDFRRYRRPVH